MVTKLQEIINYKKEEFTFRRNQTNNFDLQSKIDKQSKPRKFLSKDQLTKDKYRAISDFISGMTDRYAINLYNDNK